MFLVFNKEKIYAYLVSILTVCLLFFIASTNTNKDVETSTRAESSYNVTQEQNTNKNDKSIQKENTNKSDNLVPNDDIEDGQNE